MSTATSHVPRFWAKAALGAPDECWEWTASRTQSGYGMFHLERWRRAHRVAYEIENGPIPPGMRVCHRCDNPSCVNPAHLFLGTQAENVADRNRKQRQARGGRNARTKLAPADVRAIRASDEIGRVLAARYGVGLTTIYSIRSGATWSYLFDHQGGSA